MRTLDLIEYVVAHPSGVVAQDISAALDIPVSSLSYLLATLVECGYLRWERRLYRAGPGLDRLRVPPEAQSLAERGRPFIRTLRLQLNETASLFTLTGWEVEAIVTEAAEQTLRYSIDVGMRAPLHSVAAGQALLAVMPDAAWERYLDESILTRFTPNTLCDRDALRDRIDSVRQRGYAQTQDEHSIGISAIGVVVQIEDALLCAISVAVPTPRFTPEVAQQVIDQVRKTVFALEKR